MIVDYHSHSPLLKVTMHRRMQVITLRALLPLRHVACGLYTLRQHVLQHRDHRVL